MRRTLILAGLSTLALNLASYSNTQPLPPWEDTSRAALIRLAQEYGDLHQWAEAILATTDTLDTQNAEAARVLANQLAREMEPLEKDFENTTAALSTSQLEQILPLWERMVFAHAGFLMLQERASALGGDPALDPSELHDLAAELSAVLKFAAEIQQLIFDELTAPPPTPIRVI